MYGTPQHEEEKKSRRQVYASIIGTDKRKEILIKRKKQHAKTQSRKPNERILKFTTLIKEGPYYMCVVCNRCLYNRSVMLFNAEKYVVYRHC